MINEIDKLLEQIGEAILGDPNLDEDTKESLLELIAEVRMKPTPANIEVLSIVLEKLGDYSRLLGALNILYR